MDSILQYGIYPALITLELTKSGQITNTNQVSLPFDFLRSEGIKIAFDDFGEGYNSLRCLRIFLKSHF